MLECDDIFITSSLDVIVLGLDSLVRGSACAPLPVTEGHPGMDGKLGPGFIESYHAY